MHTKFNLKVNYDVKCIMRNSIINSLSLARFKIKIYDMIDAVSFLKKTQPLNDFGMLLFLRNIF